jgi:ankyrin repeat protein
MREFMEGDGMSALMLSDMVGREIVIRSCATTGGSMLSDDEVLTLARSSSVGIRRFGIGCGLGADAQVLSTELQSATKSGKAKSLMAYEVCHKALEAYLRESGFGKLFHIVNSRLRNVKSIENPIRDDYVRAITDSFGDLAGFVRLVWEALNFQFRETRGEVVLFREVELSEAALESYRNSIGKLIAWPMFTSFTVRREGAEGYGRAWRGGVPVLFELRSALCAGLQNGTCLLHPFAVLQVEAVTGNAVRLVEIELLEPPITGLPGQRSGVILGEGKWNELLEAARDGDVRAIARLAARPGLIDGRDADGFTPLTVAANYGRTEAVKALASLGANVNRAGENGCAPLFLAAHHGHLETVRALASLGAAVDVRSNSGATPVFVAAQEGHLEVVRVLASLGADLNAGVHDGTTPLCVAAGQGHSEVVKALVALGAVVNIPLGTGATPILVAAEHGHLDVVKALASLGADLDVAMAGGATPVFIAAEYGHLEVVKALASFGADVNIPMNDGATPLYVAAEKGHLEVLRALASLGTDVNRAMNDGTTPAFIAAYHDHVEVLKALASLGADMNVPRKDGRTPAFVAAEKGHVRALRTLALLGAVV